jgi:alkylated DNA repair dioxygenase AlkB
VSEQLALFSDDAAAPRGLRYQPSFITAQSEQELIAQIRALPLAPFQFGAFEGKRRVASFGWRYDYDQHKLEQAEDLPAWIAPLIVKVQAFAGLPAASIRQVLFSAYEKGTGIGWHRDKPHFDQVFGLSLASACKFRFRRKTGRTLAAVHARGRTAFPLHDGWRIPQHLGSQHPTRRLDALLHHVPHHGRRQHTSLTAARPDRTMISMFSRRQTPKDRAGMH